MDTAIITGRVQQALLFMPTNNSYFQSSCYLALRRTTTFTVALWVNPTTVTAGGTIMHLSMGQNGNGTMCYDLLSLTATGTLVVQIAQNSTLVIALEGPQLTSNTWTHVIVIFNEINGIRFSSTAPSS
jgi:hypothetical protein